MRPVGSLVKLYVDTRLDDIAPGDVIETGSGRRYLIETARRQEKGIHRGRWHLQAVVLAPAVQLQDDIRVIPIRWYRR